MSMLDIEKDLEKEESPESPLESHSDIKEEPRFLFGAPELSTHHSNECPEDAEKEHGDLNPSQSRSSAMSIAEQMSLPREIFFVFTICMAQFMTQVGLGQCLAILHQIGSHFAITSPSELSWLIAGYSLTVGTFILISGRLGDVFGYKRLFLIGFSWFALWSLILGLSWYSNHVLFIFARVFQGIGPAIVLTNGLAILGATYNPGPRKSMVFAMFGACAPGGSIVGAAFASLFNLTWWPWTFFSFAIALAAVVVAGWFVIPDPPRRVSTKGQSLREIIWDLDPLGAVTGVVALVLFNFAWNQAPIVGWDKVYVYILLIVGFLFFPLFFFVELRVSKAPLIPFDALSTDVIFVLGCIACGWSMFGIWVFYIWQFLETLRGASPLLTTAYLCPAAISGALASVVTGYLLQRLRAAYVMVLAMIFFMIGIILLTTCPVDQIYWAQIFVCVIIIPWGMDMSFPAATLILSNAVKKTHQGIAASLVNTCVNYSISLGLGFAGTVEVHVNHGGNTRAQILRGYRGAMYMGVGLAGLGMAIALSFLIKSHWEERKQRKEEDGSTLG